MPSPKSIMLVGNDKYARTVLANELRDIGHKVFLADSQVHAIELFKDAQQCDVTLLAFPMDGISAISVAETLKKRNLRTRIGLLTEHVEFLIISGRADGFALIDRTMSIRAILASIDAMADGKPLTITPELRQRRIDEVVAKMAKAENVTLISNALKQRYEEVLKEPMPDSIEKRLAELK